MLFRSHSPRCLIQLTSVSLGGTDPDTAATLLCLDGSTTVPVVDVLALHPRNLNHLQIDHEAQDRVPASLSALGKVPVAVIPRVRRPLRELELVGIGGCKDCKERE